MAVLRMVLRGNQEFKYFKEGLTPHFFLSVFKLFQVAVILSVSSSICERSFLAMQRINTYLRRSTMCLCVKTRLVN